MRYLLPLAFGSVLVAACGPGRGTTDTDRVPVLEWDGARYEKVSTTDGPTTCDLSSYFRSLDRPKRLDLHPAPDGDHVESIYSEADGDTEFWYHSLYWPVDNPNTYMIDEEPRLAGVVFLEDGSTARSVRMTETHTLLLTEGESVRIDLRAELTCAAEGCKPFMTDWREGACFFERTYLYTWSEDLDGMQFDPWP